MKDTYNIEEITAKTGDPVLRIDGYLLHSKYNPITEAKKFADEQYKMHHTHILFGYGKGYIVDEIVEKLKHNESIIIIDPLVEAGLIKIDERHHRNPIYYWGPSAVNTLAYHINQLATAKETEIKFMISFNYDKLFKEELKNTLEIIRDFQQKSIINQNTIFFFADKWQKNLLENVSSVVEDHTLEQLHLKYDKPVVVASGGPSLTKQLPLLKKIKEDVLIIAAGSTINSLLAENIEPDFVVSMDGGEPNYHHFKDLYLKNTRLIYSVFNHPLIRQSFENKAFTFVMNDQVSLVKYFKNKFDINLPRIVGGGTVAHYSLSIAQYISSGPIAMIGQDLAYTNNKTHAANNKHEQSINKEDENLMEVEGYYNDKVITSKVLYSMKTTFEEMAKFYPPSVPVFNCTEGGLKINGYNQISFKEFCEQYVSETSKNDDFSLDSLPIINRGSEDIIKNLTEEITIYNKLINILTEALLALKKNGLETKFSDKTLKKLNKVDEKLSELYPKVQMDFIVTPIVLEVKQAFLERDNENEFEKFKRVYDQSHTLYSKLLTVTKSSKSNTKEWLEKLKHKEKEIND